MCASPKDRTLAGALSPASQNTGIPGSGGVPSAHGTASGPTSRVARSARHLLQTLFFAVASSFSSAKSRHTSAGTAMRSASGSGMLKMNSRCRLSAVPVMTSQPSSHSCPGASATEGADRSTIVAASRISKSTRLVLLTQRGCSGASTRTAVGPVRVTIARRCSASGLVGGNRSTLLPGSRRSSSRTTSLVSIRMRSHSVMTQPLVPSASRSNVSQPALGFARAIGFPVLGLTPASSTICLR